jgi:hypothetical protein
LRFAIELCLPFIRLAGTDDANSVWERNVAEQVQSLVQIPDGYAPFLAVAGIIGDQCGLEVEIRSPLERESAFADITLILDGILPASHWLIVYTIYLKSRLTERYSLWFTICATGTFASSRSELHLEGKGDVMPLPNRDLSDWKWVKEQIAADAPVPYDANDPDDGPYDPNDDAAVDRFLTEANRVRPVPTAKDRKVAKAS